MRNKGRYCSRQRDYSTGRPDGQDADSHFNFTASCERLQRVHLSVSVFDILVIVSRI